MKTKLNIKNITSTEEKAAFASVLDILHHLRSPEGCPWDKAQTLESIRKNLLEESAELIEAIHLYMDNPNAESASNLREEFGDVFLVLSMMCVIYQDDEDQALHSIFQELAHKLIRRHPHVFESGKNSSANMSNKQLSQQWQKIKQEKEGKSKIFSAHTLRSFHPMLDTLERARKVQSELKRTQSQNVSRDLYKKLDNLTKELTSSPKQHTADKKKNSYNAENIIGNMLYTVVGLAKKHKVSPAPALLRTIKKKMQNV